MSTFIRRLVFIGVFIGLLSGCGHFYSDNPRNMKNMTAGEIERALAQ